MTKFDPTLTDSDIVKMGIALNKIRCCIPDAQMIPSVRDYALLLMSKIAPVLDIIDREEFDIPEDEC